MAVEIRMDGRFKKQLRLAFKNHSAQVGILQNKPHKNPITAQSARKRSWKKDRSATPFVAKVAGMYGTYAGGLTRKVGRGSTGTLESVAADLRLRTGINIWTRPWKDFKNREIVRFTNQFVKRMLRPKEVSSKRVVNLLQAVVRNPIIRGDYGRNSKATVAAKGFNRFMIDTGQLVKNIKARLIKRV